MKGAARCSARHESQRPGNGIDRRNDAEETIAVQAHVGDRLIEEGTHVGDHRRIGVITALRHDATRRTAGGAAPLRSRQCTPKTS
ncbi:DUF1918 domain-containing protein [Dactylosporangium sp. NPDC050588]|uniref:DUF1918 domain-containing protein n=1 Tax=Dactylosporangium sp. NPDC050588 TaxID=3157211 RepID=UPI0033F2484F